MLEEKQENIENSANVPAGDVDEEPLPERLAALETGGAANQEDKKQTKTATN